MQKSLLIVKEALRGLPGNGLGYGLLRTYHPDPEVRRQLARLPDPEISFNYLGQFDALLEDSPFSLSGEPRGAERSPEDRRTVLWDITGGVLDGVLGFDWTYSQKLHDPATIERVSNEFIQSLRQLIYEKDRPTAEFFSTEDFKEFGWDASDFKEILEELDQDDPSDLDGDIR